MREISSRARGSRSLISALALLLSLSTLLLLTARCSSDDESCTSDGVPCQNGGRAGVCFGGSCGTQVCVINGKSYAAGLLNPKSGCEICSPSHSRISWSPVTCRVSSDDCKAPRGSCDSSALGGACRGEECCVYAPAWDGQGTPPECTHGSAKGTCDAEGRCTGICTKNADCGASPCVDWTCDTTTGACLDAPRTGSCDFSGVGDGVCVAGSCLKRCQSPADCDGGPCDSNGYCLPRKANGASCESDGECASQQCECVDSPCSIRVCAADNCVCGYGTSGTCASGMAGGIADPQDCDAPGYGCQGLNQCQ